MAGPLKQVRFATRNVFHSPPSSPTVITSGFRGGGGFDASSSALGQPLSLGSAGRLTSMSTPVKGALKSNVGVTGGSTRTPMRMSSFQPNPIPAPPIPMTMLAPRSSSSSSSPYSGPALLLAPTSTPPMYVPPLMPAFSPGRQAHPYHPALHPLLDHKFDARSLHWDLRDSPAGVVALSGLLGGAEPATHPPVKTLVLRCVYLPGSITVFPGAAAASTRSSSSPSKQATVVDGDGRGGSSMQPYVTLLDVLYTIYTSLRTNVRPSDYYASLRSDSDRRRAYEAYESRWYRVEKKTRSSSSSGRDQGEAAERERKAGMKHVDLLLDHSSFTGLLPVPGEEGGTPLDWFLCVR